MSILNKLISKAGGGVIDAAGNAFDKLFTSDEERQELDNEMQITQLNHDLEIRKLGIKEKDLSLADINSARVNQSRVQESENASWLAKNIQPLLALFVTTLTFVLFFMLANGQVNEAQKDIVIYLLGVLSGALTMVLSYFFGSSSDGSANNNTARQPTIKEMLDDE